MGILVSLLASVFVYEFYAWLPRLSQTLLEVAVSRLPPSNRERYREEWQAHLNDLPHAIARLMFAITVCFKATQVNVTLIESRRGEIDSLLENLTLQLGEAAQTLKTLKLRTKGVGLRTPERVAQISHLKSVTLLPLTSKLDNQKVAEVFERATKALEGATEALVGFWETAATAIDRLRSLSETRVDRLNARVERQSAILRRVGLDYELIEGGKLSPGPRADALKRILDELSELRVTIDEYHEDDEDRAVAKRHDNLLAAMQTVIVNLHPLAAGVGTKRLSG